MAAATPQRLKLPDERKSITHMFSIGGHEGYLSVGFYPDGRPGEIFITMAKEGSAVNGLLNSFATVVSLALQYGVPLETFVAKFKDVRFEPSGWTGNPDVPYTKSIVDYIFRWLGQRFPPQPQETAAKKQISLPLNVDDCPICSNCGSILEAIGDEYVCPNCGGRQRIEN